MKRPQDSQEVPGQRGKHLAQHGSPPSSTTPAGEPQHGSLSLSCTVTQHWWQPPAHPIAMPWLRAAPRSNRVSSGCQSQSPHEGTSQSPASHLLGTGLSSLRRPHADNFPTQDSILSTKSDPEHTNRPSEKLLSSRSTGCGGQSAGDSGAGQSSTQSPQPTLSMWKMRSSSQTFSKHLSSVSTNTWGAGGKVSAGDHGEMPPTQPHRHRNLQPQPPTVTWAVTPEGTKPAPQPQLPPGRDVPRAHTGSPRAPKRFWGKSQV